MGNITIEQEYRQTKPFNLKLYSEISSTIPSPYGYHFNGWNTSREFKETPDYLDGQEVSLSVSEKTIFLNWEKNTYSVKFYKSWVDDIKYVGIKNAKYNDPISSLDELQMIQEVMDGKDTSRWSFIGWLNHDQSKKITLDNITENISAVADISKSVNLSVERHLGGNYFDTVEIYNDEKLYNYDQGKRTCFVATSAEICELISEKTQEIQGSQFNGLLPNVHELSITNDTVITASYDLVYVNFTYNTNYDSEEEKFYTVKLSSNNLNGQISLNGKTSTTLLEESVKNNEYVTIKENHDEYLLSFVKWSDGNTDNERTIKVSCDIELTAEFINKYDVVISSDNTQCGFTVNDGQVVTNFSQKINNGTEMSLSVYNPEDFKFVKWSDGNTDIERSIIISCDTRMIAEFDYSYDVLVDHLENIIQDSDGNDIEVKQND